MTPEHLTRRTLTVPLPKLTLSGELALPHGAPRGLIIFVTSSTESCVGDVFPDLAGNARALRDEGFATLRIDLLRPEESRFADACEHLPQLGERLLALIGHLRQQMLLEAIPPLPIGLVAAGAMTPLAVRVAAQRDHDVRALVCYGGLVDLAGLQYLKLLQAPLLLLADAEDTPALANAQRAQAHLLGIRRIETLDDPDVGERRLRQGTLLRAWFSCHLAP